MNADEVNAAIGLVSTVLPQAVAAYNVLKVIWLRMNPGKTEADYVAFLGTASQTNIDEADAILAADGYVRGADGHWSKPQSS